MGKTEEFHAAYESAVDKIRTGFGQKHPMIIDGQETWATSTFDDLCPADTKIVLALFQKGTRAHAKRAIKAAKSALPSSAAKPTTVHTSACRPASCTRYMGLRGSGRRAEAGPRPVLCN